MYIRPSLTLDSFATVWWSNGGHCLNVILPYDGDDGAIGWLHFHSLYHCDDQDPNGDHFVDYDDGHDGGDDDRGCDVRALHLDRFVQRPDPIETLQYGPMDTKHLNQLAMKAIVE